MLGRITNRVRVRLTFANTIGLVALFVALGGTSYAAVGLAVNSVGTPQLKNDAVISAKIRDGSLLGRDFASGQLPRREFAVVNANGTLRYGTPGVSVARYEGTAIGRYVVTFNHDVFQCALSATVATAGNGDHGAGPFSILAGPSGPGAVFVRTGIAPNRPDVDEPFYLVAIC